MNQRKQFAAQLASMPLDELCRLRRSCAAQYGRERRGPSVCMAAVLYFDLCQIKDEIARRKLSESLTIQQKGAV